MPFTKEPSGSTITFWSEVNWKSRQACKHVSFYLWHTADRSVLYAIKIPRKIAEWNKYLYSKVHLIRLCWKHFEVLSSQTICSGLGQRDFLCPAYFQKSFNLQFGVSQTRFKQNCVVLYRTRHSFRNVWWNCLIFSLVTPMEIELSLSYVFFREIYVSPIKTYTLFCSPLSLVISALSTLIHFKRAAFLSLNAGISFL